MTIELFQAKADVIAAFAAGPAIILPDERERDSRIASLLALVEMEWEGTMEHVVKVRPVEASITAIYPSEIHGSNSKIKWEELVGYLRSYPDKQVIVRYDKMHTATVTAGMVRRKWPDIYPFTERQGEEGIVTLQRG